MRFFLYSFFILLLSCCHSDYKSLRPITLKSECHNMQVPSRLYTAWYRATVDVKGHHINGLLLVKELSDTIYRVVFTNDAGLKYFDFSFLNSVEFKVEYIIKELNKKVIIEALRKDFELLLGIPFWNKKFKSMSLNEELYAGFQFNHDKIYLVSDSTNCFVIRRELGSKRIKKVTLELFGNNANLPDSVCIAHHTFDMNIHLSKIENNYAPEE